MQIMSLVFGRHHRVSDHIRNSWELKHGIENHQLFSLKYWGRGRLNYGVILNKQGKQLLWIQGERGPFQCQC